MEGKDKIVGLGRLDKYDEKIKEYIKNNTSKVDLTGYATEKYVDDAIQNTSAKKYLLIMDMNAGQDIDDMSESMQAMLDTTENKKLLADFARDYREGKAPMLSIGTGLMTDGPGAGASIDYGYAQVWLSQLEESDEGVTHVMFLYFLQGESEYDEYGLFVFYQYQEIEGQEPQSIIEATYRELEFAEAEDLKNLQKELTQNTTNIKNITKTLEDSNKELQDLKEKVDNISFNEEDPTVPAHVKSITEEDIESWNSKNDSGDIEEIYKQLSQPILKNVDNVFEFTQEDIHATYKFVYDTNTKTFKNNNVKQDAKSSKIGTTITLTKDLYNVAIRYTVSTESYDTFTARINGQDIVTNVGGVKEGVLFSGNLAAGDVLYFQYSKDSSTDGNDDLCTITFDFEDTTTLRTYRFLGAMEDYEEPYEPMYDGSPVTKKYVNDLVLDNTVPTYYFDGAIYQERNFEMFDKICEHIEKKEKFDLVDYNIIAGDFRISRCIAYSKSRGYGEPDYDYSFIFINEIYTPQWSSGDERFGKVRYIPYSKVCYNKTERKLMHDYYESLPIPTSLDKIATYQDNKAWTPTEKYDLVHKEYVDNATSKIDLTKPHKIGEIKGRPIYEVCGLELYRNGKLGYGFTFDFSGCEDIEERPCFGGILESYCSMSPNEDSRSEGDDIEHIRYISFDRKLSDGEKYWCLYANNDRKTFEVYYPSSMRNDDEIDVGMKGFNIKYCRVIFCLASSDEFASDEDLLL